MYPSLSHTIAPRIANVNGRNMTLKLRLVRAVESRRARSVQCSPAACRQGVSAKELTPQDTRNAAKNAAGNASQSIDANSIERRGKSRARLLKARLWR